MPASRFSTSAIVPGKLAITIHSMTPKVTSLSTYEPRYTKHHSKTSLARGVTILQSVKMLQKVNFLTVSIAACITCLFPAKVGGGTLCNQLRGWTIIVKKVLLRSLESHFIE